MSIVIGFELQSPYAIKLIGDLPITLLNIFVNHIVK